MYMWVSFKEKYEFFLVTEERSRIRIHKSALRIGMRIRTRNKMSRIPNTSED